MACLMRLKHDIKFLQETFHQDHPTFRVIFATVDEIVCVFLVPFKSDNDSVTQKYTINANITETYPRDPPVWFAEADEISVSVQKLQFTTDPNDNYVSSQCE